MRTALVMAASTLLASCATGQLANMTVSQGDSVTDIEYRMVLANMAMYRTYQPRVLAESPLPWHLKITQGSAEVVDTLNPTFGQTLDTPGETIGLSASRGVTVNWTFVPEIDNGHLTKLRQLYFDATRGDSFAVDFQEGSTPGGKPWGRYEGRYVWPRPGHIGALTTLALTVLADTPVEEDEKALQIPGPIK